MNGTDIQKGSGTKMRYETFEKAEEIRRDINMLMDLDSLLCNAAYGNNTLAALKPVAYGDSLNDRIINEEPLSQEMLCSFRGFLSKQIAELRAEFEAL